MKTNFYIFYDKNNSSISKKFFIKFSLIPLKTTKTLKKYTNKKLSQ